MYVPEFLMGVMSVIFAEMLSLIIYSIWIYWKTKQKKQQLSRTDKEKRNMEKPIINIERANEETIKGLIDAGVLYIGEDNKIHVR